jgi:hypothetical protein
MLLSKYDKRINNMTNKVRGIESEYVHNAQTLQTQRKLFFEG